MKTNLKITKKRLIIFISIISIVALITAVLIINNSKRNNKLNEIAKAEEEYSYQKPYIPEGFSFVEGDWNTGFVIADLATGNEFVWIPVDGNTVTLTRKNYAVTDVTMENCNEELDVNFKESVEKYGGYYVARYESSVPNNSNFESDDEMDSTGKPLSKKGATIWNNISYINAKSSAEQMYATKAEITSSLMNSYAYDTMLIWLESSGYNVETDSKTWGNYSDNSQTNAKVETSGKSENWKANNIYDIAGNVGEWTSEKTNINGEVNYIYRGGSYYNDGNITPAGIRETGNEEKTANTIGFRAIIYKTGESTIAGYDTPYIPDGFTHTEGEWNNGYVIQENSTGNEFVWIPVDGYNLNLDRSEFEKTFCSMKRATDLLELGYKLSVYAYGGYYVSRYEAGVGTTSGNNVGTPVSKKGVETWTNISQTNAQASAEKMYENNTQINSRLMNSYAYDTMLNWLKKQDYSVNTYNVDTDSTSWGNYKNNVNTTNAKTKAGSNENWKANNIYDIAGNIWEWTTEKYKTEAISRGGDYLSNGDVLPAGVRDKASKDSTFNYTGYRILMFKDVAELGKPKEPLIQIASGTEGNNGWYTSNVDVRVIAGYTALGVQKVTYSVTGTTKTAGKIGTHTYNANAKVKIAETEIESGNTFTITTDGEFTITAYTYDLEGKKSEAGTLVVKKDSTAPIYTDISITERTETQFKININGASDPTSGIYTYRYYANNQLINTSNESNYMLTNLADGTSYNVYVEIEDNAGNITKTSQKSAIYGYNRPIMPEGFSYKEGTWNTGYVIQDASGNEFVWIPVDGSTVQLGRYTFSSSGAKEYTYTTMTEKYSKIDDFKTSVNKYGGYYIGRYEQGKANVSKKNVEPMLQYYEEQATTQTKIKQAGDNAEAKIEQMARTYGYGSNVNTAMVNSYAWDTALLFISKYSGKTNYPYATPLSTYHYRTTMTSVTLTGEYDSDKYCNIYNMTDQFRELTTERHSSYDVPCGRGGADSYKSSSGALAFNRKNASYRSYYTGSTTVETLSKYGTRAVLWMD